MCSSSWPGARVRLRRATVNFFRCPYSRPRAAAVFAASAQPEWRLAGGFDLPAGRDARNARVLHAGVMAVRCLIVRDNHEFLRAAPELPLPDGISVVGVVSTGAEACRSS